MEKRVEIIMEMVKNTYQSQLEKILSDENGGLRDFKSNDEIIEQIVKLFSSRILPKDTKRDEKGKPDPEIYFQDVLSDKVKLNGVKIGIDITYYINLTEMNFNAYLDRVNFPDLN